VFYSDAVTVKRRCGKKNVTITLENITRQKKGRLFGTHRFTKSLPVLFKRTEREGRAEERLSLLQVTE
jgi:hypothetical protein